MVIEAYPIGELLQVDIRLLVDQLKNLTEKFQLIIVSLSAVIGLHLRSAKIVLDLLLILLLTLTCMTKCTATPK